MRIGHGYDAHRLIKGKGLVLGGTFIKCQYSIVAHSDGDLIIHSLIDAILGAANYGDIGTLFPSTDKKLKGISSRKLLREVVSKLASNNLVLEHVDITFVGEVPSLSPYIEEIKINKAGSEGNGYIANKKYTSN